MEVSANKAKLGLFHKSFLEKVAKLNPKYTFFEGCFSPLVAEVIDSQKVVPAG